MSSSYPQESHKNASLFGLCKWKEPYENTPGQVSVCNVLKLIIYCTQEVLVP